MRTLVGCDDDGLGPEYERHMEVVRRLNERVATAHERVACPKCFAPVGVQCRRVTNESRDGRQPDRTRPELKHSHDERLRADGIPLR